MESGTKNGRRDLPSYSVVPVLWLTEQGPHRDHRISQGLCRELASTTYFFIFIVTYLLTYSLNLSLTKLIEGNQRGPGDGKR